MKTLALLSLMLYVWLPVKASRILHQTDTPEIKDRVINQDQSIISYSDSDNFQAAYYIYGEDSLRNFILNSTFYCELEMAMDIEDTVKVQFIVQKDGQITNILVIESKGRKCLDSEAIRVIKKMSGKFMPATVNGKPVSSYAIVPIPFTLSD